jgi:hypothetical protein
VANNLFAAVKNDAHTVVEDVSKGVLGFFEFVLEDEFRLLYEKREGLDLIAEDEELGLAELKEVARVGVVLVFFVRVETTADAFCVLFSLADFIRLVLVLFVPEFEALSMRVVGQLFGSEAAVGETGRVGVGFEGDGGSQVVVLGLVEGGFFV